VPRRPTKGRCRTVRRNDRGLSTAAVGVACTVEIMRVEGISAAAVFVGAGRGAPQGGGGCSGEWVQMREHRRQPAVRTGRHGGNFYGQE